MSDLCVASTWNQKLRGFCESTLNTHTEFEQVNALTSTFIILWGVYGLYQLPSPIYQSADIWQIIYSLIICCGFGSIGQHSTASHGWSLIDSFPMLLSEFVALFYLVSMGLKIRVSNQIQMNWNEKTNETKYAFLGKFLGVVIVSLCIFSVAARCVYGGSRGPNNSIFETVFGLIPIVIFILCIWAASDPLLLKNKIKRSKEYKLVFRHLWKGFGVLLFAGIVWNISEKLCDDIEHLKYLPIHGVWHFAVSYGFYSIIQVAIYVDFAINNTIQNNKKQFHVKIMQKHDGKSSFKKIWYTLVPVLCFGN